MAKKKQEDDPMFPYPYPMMYPPSGGEDPLNTYIRFRDFFDKMAKETEEKKKTDKAKKPEPHKFTFLEAWGMWTFFGPIVGTAYLYGFLWVIQHINVMLK